MRIHATKARSGWRKFFPATAGVVALAVSVTAAALTAPRPAPQSSAQVPAFEVASIKVNKSGDPPGLVTLQPGGRFTATNRTLKSLILPAYRVQPRQALGGPNWIDSERFDIEANVEGNPATEQMWLMLQLLLADRFKLVVHRETRQIPVFALVVAKPGKLGPQLQPHMDDTKCSAFDASAPPAPSRSPSALPAPPPCGSRTVANGRMTAIKITMATLAGYLSWFRDADRDVIDRTGLNETFDLTFDLAPLAPTVSQPGIDASAPDLPAPQSIFTAVQEQLGLKLEPQTGPVEFLVIDHAEEPSPN